MPKIHENAALTIPQRKLVRELYLGGAKISAIARRFGVNRKCAERWSKRDSPYDKPSGPKDPKSVISAEYQAAIIEHRQANSDHGAITIAFYLKDKFSFANRGTVQKVLTEHGLSQRKTASNTTKKNLR